MSKPQVKDEYLGYMDDVNAALLTSSPHKGAILIWSLLALAVAFLLWASFSKLDEVTVGIGKVIPSSHLQVVQNLEGGIIKAINVREGDVVQAGDLLLRIDDTRFLSDFKEGEQEGIALETDLIRLRSELASVKVDANAEDESQRVVLAVQEMVFEQSFIDEHPSRVAAERRQYQERMSSLQNELSIMQQQIAQSRQEYIELTSKVKFLQNSLGLVSKELQITRPLAKDGVVSEVELIKLQRQYNETKGELESAKLLLPKVQAAIEETVAKRVEVALKFRKEVLAEIDEKDALLSSLNERSVGLRDRVDRTDVLSPVKGTVKKIHINTVGGVVQPGMDLIEIVPIEDNLLVEAKILPKDIAFLRPGLDAIVKFTAYDFAIYGGLRGTLEHISADTIVDEEGNSYYLVRVRTDNSFLGDAASPLPIIPGMHASVDVITGKKTVLDYLIKPIMRAQQSALRER